MDRIKHMREEAVLGNPKGIAKQHEKGRLTARECVDVLLDSNFFVEYDQLVTHCCTEFGMEASKVPGDGLVSGHVYVNGKLVFVYAYDFTVGGDTLSETVAEKACKVMDKAVDVGAPSSMTAEGLAFKKEWFL